MPPLRTSRVLLADGNVALRSVVAELLSDEPGFRVVGQVAAARDALDALRDEPVDLVLISEHLDDVPGHAVLSLLRDVAPGVVVALWTSRMETSCVGADAMVERGATYRELVRALRHALRAPQPSAAPA